MSGAGLLAGVSGALLVAGLLLAAHALTAPDTPAQPKRRRPRPASSVDRPAARRQRALWVAGGVAAAAVWLASDWPIAGVLVGLAVVGVPWLLAQFSAGNAAVERLEALQEWVRRTADILAAGGGLEQTLIRSARTAPEPIQVEVVTLAARLQARWPTDRALLSFADDLDDAAGDLVVGALLMGAELRGPGLARVLTELAGSLSEEVTMRRKVEADRAKPRANARWLLLITVAAAGLAALNGDYLAPYGTGLGQLVLAAICALIVGCLLWMRRLTVAAPSARFLDRSRRRPADRARPGGGAGPVSGTQALLIGSGAVVGLGVFLLLRAAVVVEQPRLADALVRLDGRAVRAPVGPVPGAGDRWARAAGRAGTWAAARRPGAGRPGQALELIGWTPEGYAARKVGLAAFGAAFVPLLTAVLGTVGVRLPVVIPVAGSLALAVVLFFVVDLVARDQAAEARSQMRRALCSYLDLVSLRRDASEGPTIALERAAALGDGWVFARITDALVAARLAGEPPWDGLRRLAADTGVGELADVADIAAVAAVEGASIAPTLRARASSLRVQLLAEEEAAANTASEKLTAPVALLSIAFLLLFLYPALARLMAT